MIDRAAILGLIPHAGRMCLLDAVEAWDEVGIRCTTDTHRDLGNPLRSNGRLAALHLCEYGAQAMAVHGGLLARDAGEPIAARFLTALREIDLAVDRVDDVDRSLTVTATRKMASAGGCIYEFEVSAGERRLARGRVSVMSR